MKIFFISILISLSLFNVAYAGEADVLKVEITKIDEGVYIFRVTVTHNDEGWKHYADRWEVVSPDGKILAARVLLHPHVDEQPFTRALAGVKIPKGIKEVIVRAHDSVHEYGGKTVKVTLPE
jgi:hypothetical protein